MRRFAAILALSSLLGGCSASGLELARSKYENYVNNIPDMNTEDVDQFARDNTLILEDFASLAGVTLPGANGEWRPVIDAGINYVDTRCDRFMDSLFWLNRVRETTSRQVQYTGSALGAALAVVEASKTAIGLTPLGFSLFDQTVNNIGAGLLYNLNPSTVRILVEKRQDAYIKSMTPSYTSRAVALRVIQGYAALCLPPAIEAEVERAIDAKEYTASRVSSELPPAPNDKVPNAFSFPEATGVDKGAEVTSNTIIVTGIGSAAPISIEGGEYRIVGSDASWVSEDGEVEPGQHVQVKVIAPDEDDAAKTATLTIGTERAGFTVRTKPADAGPEVTEGGQAGEGAVAEAQAPLEEAQPVTSTEEQNGIPNPQ